MAASESSFTGVRLPTDPAADVKDQFGNIAASIQFLTAIWNAFQDSTGTEPAHVVHSIALGQDGQSTNHRDWRMFINSSNNLVIDENTGTDSVPVWTTRLTLSAGTGLDSSSVDHDSTTNFVANEHVNHTSVTLTAGNGLSGGGDISASRSFALDLAELTTTGIAAADSLAFVDANDSNNPKKTLVTSFESDRSIAKTNTAQEYTAAQGSTESTPSISTNTLTLDFDASNYFEVTLDANITTMNINNTTRPGWRTIKLTQDGTGGRTVTWNASIDWAGGTAPTVSAGANDVDVYSFLVDSSGTVHGVTGGQDFS